MGLDANQPFWGRIPHAQILPFPNVRTDQSHLQNQRDYDDVSPEEFVRGVGYEAAR